MMPKTDKAAKNAANMTSMDSTTSYSELKQQLDDVLAEMQAPDCEVDRAAVLYEQALGCISQLEQQLQQVENRVEKLRADLSVRPGV